MTSPSGRADPAASIELDAALLGAWPLPLDGNGDKYSRGTVFVVGGSPTTPGAVLLAGEAALRMGAGRLQIATAREVATAVAVAMPEAAVLPLDVDGCGTLRPELGGGAAERLAGADAVVVGPGVANGDHVADLLEWVLGAVGPEATVVVDAAAIEALASAASAEALRDRIVLTPNDVELEALAGACGEGADAARVAHRFGAVVTCFGAVVAPDGRRWHTVGDRPGLGTSGSGDVLAGLAAGAAARGADPAQAACWATFAHGAAADLLAAEQGDIGFLARDLVRTIPRCLPA